MTGAHSQHRKGIVLVVAAAIAWSTAPFFTRLLPFDSWTILFWRGLFGGALIATILVLLQGRSGLQDFTGMEKSGWLVASLSTLGMVCFIPALQLTSTSNVAIIIATGPFVTAALAWIWLREVPRLRTTLASIVALCGIAIIVGGARVGSDILGLALACIMTVAIAAMTVIVRQHRNTSMVAAAALSNILGCVVSIPFAQGIAAVTGFDLFIFAMFGFFQVALGGVDSKDSLLGANQIQDCFWEAVLSVRNRLVLSDAAWERMAPLIIGRPDQKGSTGRDNRMFVEGVLWIVRTGSPWRDLPEVFGDWNSVFRRFSRWSIKGVWWRIFEAMSDDPDFEYLIVDSTIVRAHQHAAGAKKGGLKIRRSAARAVV